MNDFKKCQFCGEDIIDDGYYCCKKYSNWEAYKQEEREIYRFYMLCKSDMEETGWSATTDNFMAEVETDIEEAKKEYDEASEDSSYEDTSEEYDLTLLLNNFN